ncbi:dead/deah box helicase [Rhodococcus erythropolis CCM2595]|nr:dead/deah box helicase [Rhodococcus erythropolis CCM2595]SUE12064.1 dead/deah box helicase [Rhodococcus erythropolis]
MSDRLDPLETGHQIEDGYKRYLKTLLAPSDPAIAHAFSGAIDNTDLLTKGPLLELTPPYAAGSTLQEMVNDGVLHPEFVGINSRVVPLDRPLYVHQETAIRKVVAGRNLVVSTGTGSGKTESFLLPILNSLIAERAAGKLGPGVRALLLYPMNALANDQLGRLREMLKVLPDITFGRYTGEAQETAARAESLYKATNPGQGRLPNELLSRQEMRENPPNILLTNYAMLEYLLLRPTDLDLFDGPHAGTWRFIALDEAHVYDGAQGSEIALLLRRLRQRVSAGNDLQCIATSASLDGDPVEAMTFARNLFDAPFEFVDGDANRQDLVRATRQARAATPTWKMTDEELFEWAAADGDLTKLETKTSSGDAADALHSEYRIAELQTHLRAEDGEAIGLPVAAQDLKSRLWPHDSAAEAKLEALVALGSKVHDASGNPVLSARYHMFVRATEGAFISFADEGPKVMLGRHEIDPETSRAVFEFGTCQRCGAVHLAGEVENRQRQQFFIPPKDDSSVRWLVLADGDSDSTVDEDEATLSDEEAKEEPGIRYLCTGCGHLGDTDAGCGHLDCPGGAVRRVREHKFATRVMSQCTECGARARQVIRRLRTDTNAAPAVITTALYQQLPPATDSTVEEVGEGRKLLMFSDSRQSAAFAAPYLERTYGRLLERRYLTQALQDKKYEDDDLTVEDLALVVRKKAKDASHFPENAGRVAMEKAANEWVVGELMTMDQRQSLEGLGLMRVSLARSKKIALPKAFGRLGLTEDESWGLLDELVKTARLQGVMNLLDEVDIKSERFEPRNMRIRMRLMESDRTRKVLSWLPSGRAGTTNNRVKFVDKVLRAVGVDAPVDKVLDGCWRFLLDAGYISPESDKFAADVFQINHAKLCVHNGLDVDWYRCDACRRVTAFNVRGVCSNSSCPGTLESYVIPSVEADSNHYRNIYRTLNAAPMSAMEHTAQWDAKEAATIQKDFIDGRVNVLSCSTTFELGVDVGDLQSVVMRNMPPKTSNYVQRAGRAGRRAASAALVVTYANRNSHDLAKYQSPESMIAGKMRIPWVPIENERIGRRHAHSVALSAFFRYAFQSAGTTWKYAGEFFTPPEAQQDSPASTVRAFLTPVPAEIKDALRQVLPLEIQEEIGVETNAWVEYLDKLLTLAEEDVREDLKVFRQLIDDAKEVDQLGLANKLLKTLRTIENRQLLGFLANKNILPKYGFPVDTVELRTLHCQEPIGSKLELSRDLSQAIYDYAPGNQVVAGGKVWTSRGLHKLPKRELDELKYRVCRNCARFQCGRELDVDERCPSCDAQFDKIRSFVIPEYGFVADREAHDVGTVPPERRWHGASYVENVGDQIDIFTWNSTGGMEVSARAGTRATLAVISDGDGGGFYICDWCGWGKPVGGKLSSRKHERPHTGQACDGPLRVVSLAHRYQTDVAEFTFADVAYSKESEAQWMSVLYALLEGASEALEISRDDIDGTLSWSADGRRSIVLFDTVPAGAGAAKKIAENLGAVLEGAVERVQSCECGEETSCYGCLRSYRNARHHEKLSRRGALAIFRHLQIDGADSTGAWGQDLEGTSASVSELLLALALLGVHKPEMGIEMGDVGWPVEAVWRQPAVVLVEGNDGERDTWLKDDGFVVVHAEETNADLLVGMLAQN